MSSLLFSIILPTLNAAHRMGETLYALNNQTYEQVELIVVDAGSTDRTLDIVQRTYRGEVRLASVSEYNLPEMVNRGISLAKGEYVCILHPGDSYLSASTLEKMATLIEEEGEPDLAYCGCLLREGGRSPRLLLRPFSFEELRKGHMPTSLQGCWLRIHTLRQVGKLDANFRTRNGFELLCRLAQRKELRIASHPHILIEHDRSRRTSGFHLQRKWETGRILLARFGKRAMLRWWLNQNPWLFFRWWWQSRSRHWS